MATYALTFCLDNIVLKQRYPKPERWKDAYQEIAQVLGDFGFVSYQSAMYFGLPEVNVVQGILAAQRLAQNFDWFIPSLIDIRLLEVSEMSDLMFAIETFKK